MDPLLSTNGHNPGEELWSPKVVMTRTGLSRSTIYSDVAEGIFPTQRRRAGHQPPEEWSFTVVLSEITKKASLGFCGQHLDNRAPTPTPSITLLCQRCEHAFQLFQINDLASHVLNVPQREPVHLRT